MKKRIYTIFYIGITLMLIIINITTWYLSQVNIFFVFATVLLISMGIIMWYKIELKRFFRLMLLPLLIISVTARIIETIKKSTIDFSNLSWVDISFFSNAIGDLFLFIGGVVFVFVFFMYIIFPVLVLFSLSLLIIEKFFGIHYRLLILISPLIVILLLVFMEAYLNTSSKLVYLGRFSWFIVACFTIAVTIEQYLYYRKKR